MTTERPAASAPIVLPRPNLGPEPWPDAPALPWAWPLVGSLVLFSLAAGLRLRKTRRRKRVPVPTDVPEPVIPPAPTGAEDRVREALVDAFGPAWRAMTTEEIASSPGLADRFGPEVAARVVAYLGAVDRAKFSGHPGGPDDDLAWWADRFVEEVDAGRGGGSTAEGG